jgi:hypothetical protein
MKITWNWGTGITLTYLAFVALIMFMVIKSCQQKIDLVTPDYYSKELAYQEKIDAITAYSNLTEKPKFKWENTRFELVFPASLAPKSVKGKIDLYCPSNNQLDKSFVLQLDEGNRQLIDFGQLPAGKYELTVEFTAQNKNYVHTETIFF